MGPWGGLSRTMGLSVPHTRYARIATGVPAGAERRVVYPW